MYETNRNMPIISHAELHSFFVWIRRTCFSKIQSRIISLLIQEQKKRNPFSTITEATGYICLYMWPQNLRFCIMFNREPQLPCMIIYFILTNRPYSSNTNVKGNINEDSKLTILYHHNIIWHVLDSLITSF